ncbi:uncharacterized protein LOC121413304 [Lytechinus variegatus]|uniref:uncharacterized protein LOC121413304 n=1 Tax=Lytechinus variegatus TaxID=7654 RepID=UPI001BB2BC1B|nr:uncharacterized protein LOC121413304 [Lytechinus variegatus]
MSCNEIAFQNRFIEQLKRNVTTDRFSPHNSDSHDKDTSSIHLLNHASSQSSFADTSLRSGHLDKTSPISVDSALSAENQHLSQADAHLSPPPSQTSTDTIDGGIKTTNSHVQVSDITDRHDLPPILSDPPLLEALHPPSICDMQTGYTVSDNPVLDDFTPPLHSTTSSPSPPHALIGLSPTSNRTSAPNGTTFSPPVPPHDPSNIALSTSKVDPLNPFSRPTSSLPSSYFLPSVCHLSMYPLSTLRSCHSCMHPFILPHGPGPPPISLYE